MNIIVMISIGPIVFQHALTEWIDFAGDNVLPAHPFGRKFEATDAAE